MSFGYWIGKPSNLGNTKCRNLNMMIWQYTAPQSYILGISDTKLMARHHLKQHIVIILTSKIQFIYFFDFWNVSSFSMLVLIMRKLLLKIKVGMRKILRECSCYLRDLWAKTLITKCLCLHLCCLCLMDGVLIFRAGLIDYGPQLTEHFKYSLIFCIDEAIIYQTDRKHRS